ncbi:hypothetical protein WME76_02190 [Sorangium sp. So ce119]|uniref:hypothetical protein n=1 Tax=Sorangium sp. So ce119 TaxID=3133279 RepID=UPI003F5E5010
MEIKFESVKEAADAWAEAKLQSKRADAVMEAAEPVLMAYFDEHPDAEDYDGRIALTKVSQVRLDNAKVKTHLGLDLFRFQRTISYRSLALITK